MKIVPRLRFFFSYEIVRIGRGLDRFLVLCLVILGVVPVLLLVV